MLNYVRLSRKLWYVVVSMCIFVTLVTGAGVVAAASARNARPALVGPKANYLALGDSLAFGYQPDRDYRHGYARDYFRELSKHGVHSFLDFGCPGETSTTMIKGGCAALPSITPSQLLFATSYLKLLAGKVSPVTLDIGANDVLNNINLTTCVVNEVQFNRDLRTLDTNLRQVILPRLHAALTVHGRVTGDLLMMNYYDPYQNICPGQSAFTATLNQHLLQDVQGYGTLVDVFSAFGGAQAPNPNLCSYTWMCSNPPDIHATDRGYQVIANAFAATAGY